MQVTRRAKIIWGILAVSLLVLGGVRLWQDIAAAPPPPLLKERPQPQGQKTTPAQNAATPVPVAAASVVFPSDVVTGGNLAKLTQLRAEKEEVRLLHEIEELRSKTRALKTPPALMPTDIPAVMPELPPLSPPSPSKSAPAASPPKNFGPVVIAVQGVSGELSAVIRTGGRTITVRKGGNVAGGVVTDISRSGVIVRRGGKTATLPFE